MLGLSIAYKFIYKNVLLHLFWGCLILIQWGRAGLLEGPLTVSLQICSFLAYLTRLRVSFWNTVMSVVGRTCGRPRCPCCPKRRSVKFMLVYTLEGTVLIGSTWNFVRTIIFMKFRSSSNLGHVESKTKSLGQILGKPCVHSRRHSLEPKFMKLCQNGNSYKI